MVQLNRLSMQNSWSMKSSQRIESVIQVWVEVILSKGTKLDPPPTGLLQANLCSNLVMVTSSLGHILVLPHSIT
jgi:hypothetical protein